MFLQTAAKQLLLCVAPLSWPNLPQQASPPSQVTPLKTTETQQLPTSNPGPPLPSSSTAEDLRTTVTHHSPGSKKISYLNTVLQQHAENSPSEAAAKPGLSQELHTSHNSKNVETINKTSFCKSRFIPHKPTDKHMLQDRENNHPNITTNNRCCMFCGIPEETQEISNDCIETYNERGEEEIIIENKILKEKITSLENELNKFKKHEKQLEEYRISNCELFKKNLKLLDDLKTASNKSKEDGEKRAQEILSEVFTTGQVKRLLGAKRVVWNSEDISSAMALHSAGSKAYQFMRYKMKIPLPCITVLRKWARKLPCKPGIQSEVLRLMAMKAESLSSREKLLVLSFDEMKISSKYCYDKGLDQVQGPYGNAQVVMLRSLFSNWKQPIYYQFDQQMTREIYLEIVCDLHQAGYTVVSTVCDLGGGNRGFWTQLGINMNNVSIRHPSDPNTNIYFFGDAPHMLKLFRNHFLDDGFHFDGQFVTKTILQNTLDEIMKDKSEIRLAHKLDQGQLTVTKRGRQRVKPILHDTIFC